MATKRVMISMSEEEYSAIKEAADKADIGFSKYIRDKAFSPEIPPFFRNEIYEIYEDSGLAYDTVVSSILAVGLEFSRAIPSLSCVELCKYTGSNLVRHLTRLRAEIMCDQSEE